MIRNPVYAAPDEHASELSGSISSNTLQKGSMEPNIEVSKISDCDKAEYFPFMKLPVGESIYLFLLRA